MRCPIDGSTLNHQPVERKFQIPLNLDLCRTCQGVFVDYAELPQLMAHFGSDHQKTYRDWLSATTSGQTAPRDFWSETDRLCPKDNSVMKRHYTGMAHRVGVDQCQQCGGFWFDGDELFAVAEANQANLVLDQALSGSLHGMQEILSRSYDPKAVEVWDFPRNPSAFLPPLDMLLFGFMADFIFRR